MRPKLEADSFFFEDKSNDEILEFSVLWVLEQNIYVKKGRERPDINHRVLAYLMPKSIKADETGVTPEEDKTFAMILTSLHGEVTNLTITRNYQSIPVALSDQITKLVSPTRSFENVGKFTIAGQSSFNNLNVFFGHDMTQSNLFGFGPDVLPGNTRDRYRVLSILVPAFVKLPVFDFEKILSPHIMFWGSKLNDSARPKLIVSGAIEL